MQRYKAGIGPVDGDVATMSFNVIAPDVYQAAEIAERRLRSSGNYAGLQVKSVVRRG